MGRLGALWDNFAAWLRGQVENRTCCNEEWIVRLEEKIVRMKSLAEWRQ